MSSGDKEQLPAPVAPARGARAGVRSDVNRSKEGSYNPVGTGTAWSHNFLNQKPWHPLNFRNQVRKYEAEQKAVSDHKAREAAMAEWQAEQEKNATLAFLSPAEAKKQKDRSTISFMYQKPPGLEAALARDREQADKKHREAAAAAATAGGSGTQQQLQPSSGGALAAAGGALDPSDVPNQQQQLQEQQRQRQQQLERLREDPFAAILAARNALQTSEKFVLKSVEGAYGGLVPGCDNQLLLGDEDGEEDCDLDNNPSGEGQQKTQEEEEAEALLASLEPGERAAVLAALDKKRRRAVKAARLQQAQELLRSAGIDPAALETAGGGGSSSKHHRRDSSSSKKRKHKHRDKKHKDTGEKSMKHHKQKKLSRKHKRHKERSHHDSSRHNNSASSNSGSSSSSGDEDESRRD